MAGPAGSPVTPAVTAAGPPRRSRVDRRHADLCRRGGSRLPRHSAKREGGNRPYNASARFHAPDLRQGNVQKLLIAAALCLVLFVPIRTSLPVVAVAAAGGDPVVKTIVGWASYYGPGFHGRRTASGEIFDMHQPVAAHRTLPLGTVARVTNLSNGRSVVVRITDRGPYIKGRILDVSKGAARSLAFVRDGLARVRVEVLAVEWRDATTGASRAFRTARLLERTGR